MKKIKRISSGTLEPREDYRAKEASKLIEVLEMKSGISFHDCWTQGVSPETTNIVAPPLNRESMLADIRNTAKQILESNLTKEGLAPEDQQWKNSIKKLEKCFDFMDVLR